jgi:thioredoxin reductase
VVAPVSRALSERKASSSPARKRAWRGLLETSVHRVYAAGDVRAGSIKRCATAVGEGAAVVRFVHEHLAPAVST